MRCEAQDGYYGICIGMPLLVTPCVRHVRISLRLLLRREGINNVVVNTQPTTLALYTL